MESAEPLFTSTRTRASQRARNPTADRSTAVHNLLLSAKYAGSSPSTDSDLQEAPMDAQQAYDEVQILKRQMAAAEAAIAQLASTSGARLPAGINSGSHSSPTSAAAVRTTGLRCASPSAHGTLSSSGRLSPPPQAMQQHRHLSGVVKGKLTEGLTTTDQTLLSATGSPSKLRSSCELAFLESTRKKPFDDSSCSPEQQEITNQAVTSRSNSPVKGVDQDTRGGTVNSSWQLRSTRTVAAAWSGRSSPEVLTVQNAAAAGITDAQLMAGPIAGVELRHQREVAAAVASSTRALFPVSREDALQLQQRLDTLLPVNVTLSKQAVHLQALQRSWAAQQQTWQQQLEGRTGAAAETPGYTLVTVVGDASDTLGLQDVSNCSSGSPAELQQPQRSTSPGLSPAAAAADTAAAAAGGGGGDQVDPDMDTIEPSLQLDYQQLDQTMQEAAQQVAVGCLERGQLLDSIRLRYSELLNALQLALAAVTQHAQHAQHTAATACQLAVESRAAAGAAAAAAAAAEQQGRELREQRDLLQEMLQQQKGEHEEAMAAAEARNQSLRDQLAALQQQLEQQEASSTSQLQQILAATDDKVAAAESARADMAVRLGLMEQQLAAFRAARAKKVPTSEDAVQTDPLPDLVLPVIEGPAAPAPPPPEVVEAPPEEPEVEGPRPIPRKRLAQLGGFAFLLPCNRKGAVKGRLWLVKTLGLIYQDHVLADAAEQQRTASVVPGTVLPPGGGLAAAGGSEGQQRVTLLSGTQSRKAVGSASCTSRPGSPAATAAAAAAAAGGGGGGGPADLAAATAASTGPATAASGATATAASAADSGSRVASATSATGAPAAAAQNTEPAAGAGAPMPGSLSAAASLSCCSSSSGEADSGWLAFCRFVVQWHMQRYGLPELAEATLLDLIATAKYFAGLGHTCALWFCGFCGLLPEQLPTLMAAAAVAVGQPPPAVGLTSCILTETLASAFLAQQDEQQQQLASVPSMASSVTNAASLVTGGTSGVTSSVTAAAVAKALQSACMLQAVRQYTFCCCQLAFPSTLSALFPEGEDALPAVKGHLLQDALRAVFRFLAVPDAAAMQFLQQQLPAHQLLFMQSGAAITAAGAGTGAGAAVLSAAAAAAGGGGSSSGSGGYTRPQSPLRELRVPSSRPGSPLQVMTTSRPGSPAIHVSSNLSSNGSATAGRIGSSRKGSPIPGAGGGSLSSMWAALGPTSKSVYSAWSMLDALMVLGMSAQRL